MPAYFLRLKYLILVVSFFSLRAQGQTLVYQDSLNVNVVKDTVRIAPDTTFVPLKNSKEVDELISFAKRFLGTPYRYAGTTPSGFDCSGFISYIFGNFGFSLVHSSYGMAELGKTVKLSEIRPGDLMFFKGSDVNSTRVGHVAMVVEVSPTAIKFIHSSTSRGVTIDNFKTSKYFIARFIKAKRLDWGEPEK
jgi:cell wall-associated NlpC family hydrolase